MMKLYKLILVSTLLAFAYGEETQVGKLPQGCKCEQIQLKTDCESTGLYCKWSGSKCEVKPCAERDGSNCKLGLMFGHVDETNCFMDPLSNTCVEKTKPDCPNIALVYQDSDGNDLEENALRGICHTYDCDYETDTKTCIAVGDNCDYSTLGDCVKHLYGTDGVKEGSCIWASDSCEKQKTPIGCSDYIYSGNCPMQCKWDVTEKTCRFNKCSELSGMMCKLLSEITDNGTAKVCQQKGDGCEGISPSKLDAGQCLARLYNFYAWNTETEICEICVKIQQNYNIDKGP